MNRSKLDQLMQFASELLAPSGFDCIEAEWADHDRILRLFIDHRLDQNASQGAAGVSMEDCVAATRLLNDSAELDALVSGAYTLEVSSPGVERPLRRPCDFARFVGKRASVSLRTKDLATNRWKAEGMIARMDGDQDEALITLDTDQGLWSFPVTNLKKASLVFDWSGH